ncbi:MAG TPA: RDD family protein [Pyrinomonadaceae bacterium]|jgi:uncharacterized RDD family membrane protein YckC
MEKYETLRKRFGAAFVDTFILVPVNLVISFATVFFNSSATAVALSSAVAGLISVFYYILAHYYYGQTVGKMLAKVKVLDDSEKQINFGQAVLRSFPQLIMAMFAFSFSNAQKGTTGIVGTLIYWLVMIFGIADILVCLMNEKHRALHDFIAGTIVVRTDV